MSTNNLICYYFYHKITKKQVFILKVFKLMEVVLPPQKYFDVGLVPLSHRKHAIKEKFGKSLHFSVTDVACFRMNTPDICSLISVCILYQSIIRQWLKCHMKVFDSPASRKVLTVRSVLQMKQSCGQCRENLRSESQTGPQTAPHTPRGPLQTSKASISSSRLGLSNHLE